MATDAQVKAVNAELRKHHEEAVGYRESPRLIAVMDCLIRLTNSKEDNEKLDAEREAAKPKCPHDVVNRKTGKCIQCGEVPED